MSDTGRITKMLEQWGVDDAAIAAELARTQENPVSADTRIYHFAGTLIGCLRTIAEDHHGCRRKKPCLTCIAVRSALTAIAADDRLAQTEAAARGRS